MIRSIQLTDATALTDIYNYYVRTSGVTFEEVEISNDEMRNRISKIHFTNGFPFIVYTIQDEIVGYAYVTSFRERSAYRFTVESTVYVANTHFGKGIGKELYAELIRRTKDAGFHSIMGVITLPNDASVQLHEYFGFKKAGHFTEVGYKFDNWMDVGYWELLL